MNERAARPRLPPGQVLTPKWPVLSYGASDVHWRAAGAAAKNREMP